ncbi:MAG: type I-B CRISPR-associated protein Cas7/Csh2 [Candidatus Cloacimonetes bacterium]|jgi:CRISPR-associated protein Csh2|nr:type I-B CRISPR-associated protein Cas7/Csh2 [Candidatus Cloacimonadota bacterium]MCK9332768.1 type I-B CRISPR-associated protein Cas7/Csh2 [Candidatus Cloacimonadota bacterium]
MIKNNSEILFLYDAMMCNPNGDMDDENKPRMDYDTSTNLVSDVRLKRYIRDYFETAKGQEIFITAKAKDAKDRNNQIKAMKLKHTDMVDVRLFGAVTAEDKRDEGHYTGPVQFNWGYSLNPVELIDSSTITSSFSSGQGIGKDYRVQYSLIAFSGSINANASEKTLMTDEDMHQFDEAILKSIPLARTRSKTGQYPRLYLRIELKNKESFLKDLRPMLQIKLGDVSDLSMIRKTEDYSLVIDPLVDYLSKNSSKITKIHYFKDEQLFIPGFERIFVNQDWKHELSLF